MARAKLRSGKKRSSPKSSAVSPGIDYTNVLRRDVNPSGLSRRTTVLVALGVALLIASAATGFYILNAGNLAWTANELAAATFVGSETCAGCHQAEAKLWHGSHHEQAMDHATEKSVLGDFNDASFDYYGVRSRFFRDGGKFLVETDGPDGKLETFEVKYTFGIYPLQQYLIEFADGRIQALSSPGTAGRRSKAASAGFISTRTRRSSTTISCIGPS